MVQKDVLRSSMGRYIIFILLATVGVVTYHYWNSTATNTELALKLEALTVQLTTTTKELEAIQKTNANQNKTNADNAKTISDLTSKVTILEGQMQKANASIAEEKKWKEKAESEVKTLSGEKSDLTNKLKTEQSKVEKCNISCENKLKEVKAECPTRQLDGGAGAAQPAVISQ